MTMEVQNTFMHRLLSVIMRGRTSAMTASAICAVLSLLVPPLSYISGAIIGLATLKNGPREGALVVGGSTLLAGFFSLVMIGNVAPTGAFIVMSWLPAWLLAWLLLRWQQQGLVLIGAAVMGMLAVLTAHLAIDDPAAWWLAIMRVLFEPALLEAAPNQVQLDSILRQWAPFMTQYFGAATASGVLLTTFLARHWHSILDNPGGFGEEFRAIRVGRGALLVAVVLTVTGLMLRDEVGAVIADLAGPVAAMLVFLGLAVGHGLIKLRKLGYGWLVAIYVLLLVPPHLAATGLSMLGLLDGWMDFRSKVKPAA